MKADKPFVFVVAAFRCAHAFQSEVHSTRHVSHRSHIASSSPLFAKKKKENNGGGKGFGASSPKKDPKYSIDDKSYGSTSPRISSSVEQSLEESQNSMADFFSTYSDWKPLFRNVMMSPSSNNNNHGGMEQTASSFLSDVDHPQELWGISTLEQRNPWRLLPSKPTSESSLETLSTFLDEWQQSLLDIPLDSIITGDNDLHFLEEGRRTIAVTRFHVLDNTHNSGSSSSSSEMIQEEGSCCSRYDWESELFRTCWSELAHLMSQDDDGTGSLVLLPNHVGVVGEEGEGSGAGLDYVRNFVESNILQPIRWLGREDDWEIVAMERGSLGVRLLYKLGDMPDLSERDSSGDENVKM